MPQTFDSIRAMLTHGFDTVIDVRSPAEFAIDHLPGAINLPALTNDQRADVGTMYKQVSPFDARKIGATLVAATWRIMSLGHWRITTEAGGPWFIAGAAVNGRGRSP